MARDQNLHPMNSSQAVTNDLKRLRREIDLLSKRTSTTIQIKTIGEIDDPIEGEIIIDRLDGEFKWYSNGTWRLCEALGIFEKMSLKIDYLLGSPSSGTLVYTNSPYTISVGVQGSDYTSPINGALWLRMNSAGNVWKKQWAHQAKYIDNVAVTDGPGTDGSQWHTITLWVDIPGNVNDAHINGVQHVDTPPRPLTPFTDQNYHFNLWLVNQTNQASEIWIDRIQIGSTQSNSELWNYNPSTDGLAPLTINGDGTAALATAPILPPSGGSNSIHMSLLSNQDYVNITHDLPNG